MALIAYTRDGRPKDNGSLAVAALVQKAWSTQSPATNGSYTAHPDGTYTFTATTPGYYRVVLSETTTHNNTYTQEDTTWTVGGTAQRLDNLQTLGDWGEENVDGNRSTSHVLLFNAQVGQTITLLPNYRVAYTTGTHSFFFHHLIEQIASSVGVAPEPWTNVSSFSGTWVNFDTVQVARFMKDPNGFVHLGGNIKSGTLATSAFTLPVGYRPGITQRFATVSNNAFGYLIVNTDGTCVPQVGSATAFDLSGVTFRAEQ